MDLPTNQNEIIVGGVQNFTQRRRGIDSEGTFEQRSASHTNGSYGKENTEFSAGIR